MTIYQDDNFRTPDTFATALVRVERLGSCRRLVFIVHGTDRDEAYLSIVAKLVVPAEALQEIVQALLNDAREPGEDCGYRPVVATAH